MENDVDFNLYSAKKATNKQRNKPPTTVNLEDGNLSVLPAHLVAKWSESAANFMQSLANHSMESQLTASVQIPAFTADLFPLASDEGCLFDHASTLWLFPNGSISAVIFYQEQPEIQKQ